MSPYSWLQFVRRRCFRRGKRRGRARGLILGKSQGHRARTCPKAPLTQSWSKDLPEQPSTPRVEVLVNRGPREAREGGGGGRAARPSRAVAESSVTVSCVSVRQHLVVNTPDWPVTGPNKKPPVVGAKGPNEKVCMRRRRSKGGPTPNPPLCPPLSHSFPSSARREALRQRP